MSYKHIDMECLQASKKTGAPCGDAFVCQRTAYHTTLILADGIGSGIKAHIASQMNIARLSELLSGGASLRSAFLSVVSTMSQWRDHSMPFCAFLIARILNDGLMNILSYEMPAPIFIGNSDIHILKAGSLVVEAGVASEYRCRLHPKEGVLFLSDGITQAGLGGDLANGWGVEGIENFLVDLLDADRDLKKAARDVMRQAQVFDGEVSGDDKTVMVACCREGEVVNLFTGPPKDKGQDSRIAGEFLKQDGLKVICGASTADVVSRHCGSRIEVEQRPLSFTTPPRYFIDGIDLVTEGAVTLNQVYNILDEDLTKNSDKSAAADLACMLKASDWLRFTVGHAMNPANADLVFRKQGILPREKIIPLIAGKLEKMGKLVDIRDV